MTDKLNEKVNHHEWRLNQQDQKIVAMEAKQSHMSRTLDSILGAVKQIKVVAITVGFMLVLSELGILETIKRLL